MSDHEHLPIVSFYMEGPALAWYQWMTCNGQISSWLGLLQALEAQFVSSHYEDPIGTLFKLTQRHSVNDYLLDFETLANCIIGLPPPFLLSCFISCLSPEIRRKVQALQPPTLVQVVALAHLQEKKFCDSQGWFPEKSSFTVSPSLLILQVPPPNPPRHCYPYHRNNRPYPSNAYHWRNWRCTVKWASASIVMRVPQRSQVCFQVFLADSEGR